MRKKNESVEAAIKAVIDHPAVGSQANLARLLDVKPPTVAEWVAGKRPVPSVRAVEMESLVGGDVPKETLCPTFPWHLMNPTQAA
tara:strand:- start:37606 stop:37860 length:255 start_codon:yes stop_codon:yes gene_type:complete